ncbi:MAG: DNA primase [Candidatus Omnitrophota bacterium]
MSRIPQEIIDRILDRTDIVEIISEHIPIKRTGRNYKACCPFHNEKTPSFVVSPDKQIYHCFGCGAGGNAMGFLMNYENLEFRDAVEILASKAGIELPKDTAKADNSGSLVSQIYELNAMAALFFQKYLKSATGRTAVKYLLERGVNGAAIDQFRIGFAPDEWEAFHKFAKAKGIPDDVLRKAGLIIPSQKGKGDYDRFRNRIIFPIFNERGHIIGFGGRVLDKSLPKYINSPETPAYSKSDTLYALNFAKTAIREKKYAVIVEGYMDVVMAFQHGITNIVAASGTALTFSQVNKLKKYTDTAVIIFDSDAAGETASLRGLDVLIESGMGVKLSTLPDGHDPDSYVRKYGKEKFQRQIEGAKNLFDYKLDLLIKKNGQNNIAVIVDEMLPTIAKVENKVIQSDYLKNLAQRLQLHEQSLRHEIKKIKPDNAYSFHSRLTPETKQYSYRGSELYLLALALTQKAMFEKILATPGIDGFRDESIRGVMLIARDIYEVSDEINLASLLGKLEAEKDLKSALVQAAAKTDIISDPEKTLEDCISCILKENRDENLRHLNTRLKQAEELKNEHEIMELITKINKIVKEKVA